MHVTLAELARLLEGEVVGEAQTVIRGLAPLEQAQSGDLTFVAEDKYVARLADSRASAVLVAPHLVVDR
jgi:UDP-3-O-[3-hydroxymyristoyl] glucosamine N-acyltransferase